MLTKLSLSDTVMPAAKSLDEQCLCWRGVPNKPDNTVIQGLGQVEIPKIEIPAYLFNDPYTYKEVAQVSEPSLVFPSLIFCLLGLIKTKTEG